MQLKKNEKGIGLIEVIAALGIATMVITALVSLGVFTLRSSLKSKLVLESSKVANRELELLRAFRDKSSWTTFLEGSDNTLGVTECAPDSSNTPVCYMDLSGNFIENGTDPANLDEMPIDGIARGFYANYNAERDIVSVTVIVQWREGNEFKRTTLRSDLTNWQQR